LKNRDCALLPLRLVELFSRCFLFTRLDFYAKLYDAGGVARLEWSLLAGT